MAQEARIDVTTLFHEAAGDPNAPELSDMARMSASGPWFGMPGVRRPAPGTARYQEWPLRSHRPYLGVYGRGTARMYLANGHDAPVRPFLFADGFAYGPSDLDGLFDWLDAPYSATGDRFLDQLLSSGVDVILIGFDKRHDYIQVNAGVVQECIHRVLRERVGAAPLMVGGVSLGGMITRYALAQLESEQVDHETAVYLSLDSPHNGAWIPLILQQMAYFFEQFGGDTPGQADLLRSPAAQQLTWAWVRDSRYSGPVATSSPLRAQFLRELREIGNFPHRPIKLGVANGRGDGVGSDRIVPGEIAFEKRYPLDAAGAVARFQPDNGELEWSGGMHFMLEQRTTRTTAVPPLDGAPGGLLDSFGRVADVLGVELDPGLRSGCFVPSVSAVAVDYDPVQWEVDLHENLRTLDPSRSLLDEFCCNDTNSEHSRVTRTLAEWILARIAK